MINKKKRMKKIILGYSMIFIGIIGFIFLGIVAKHLIGKEILREKLCSDSENYGYPSWYREYSTGYIGYIFSNYSSTMHDETIGGKIYYNYRESTREELTRRFIDNNIYFVYSDNEISNKQISDFKRDNFWNKYQNSGMTFYCN